ncbi:homeobox-leucine zipper protein HOX32-like isoform X2 [Amaranthus tricolor]|uniref:homeobox-leucine zipper protein HOX32-like isoform X2 n=1 Tax=Amaranthus tricolor TaxID=29722 RepID=UPI002588186D|nr:homeobox-leucine zipper protein HOX32-like isoform X2 [Amaranthus tricolor]
MKVVSLWSPLLNIQIETQITLQSNKLLSVAEETLVEFFLKETWIAVDWVQMLGMKPGPDSVRIFAISHSCNGVAARACGLVSLEPTKYAPLSSQAHQH